MGHRWCVANSAALCSQQSGCHWGRLPGRYIFHCLSWVRGVWRQPVIQPLSRAESGRPAFQAGTGVQCGNFGGPGQGTFDFGLSSRRAWIVLGSWVPQEANTGRFLSYRKCWLRKEAACREIRRWVFREVFVLFDNEVSGSARGQGQTAVPIGYINSTYYCSLQSHSNKTKNNRWLEYPAYRCSLYCVEISILYSSECYCFRSRSIPCCGFSPVGNRVSLIKQLWLWVSGNIFCHSPTPPCPIILTLFSLRQFLLLQ